jgi:crotonobetainyl-CoA:carnitine CoA-transferase CaiB-like acyl-CoA transferase
VNPLAPVLAELSAGIAERTARLGRPVAVGAMGVLDRTGHLPLGEPGRTSPNGACRLARAADGWIAVNLARAEDAELVPAWLGGDLGEAPWGAVERLAPQRGRAELVAAAAELGLPVAAVGEVTPVGAEAPQLRLGAPRTRGRGPLKVVDLSVLWAGPLCGAVLARMGAAVTRIESLGRPDPSRGWTPDFFRRLNGEKAELALDLRTPAARARLRAEVLEADVVITAARPRGLAGLGLDAGEILAARPGLVWVAITGYGFTGAAATRVAFGDDAAAAGGLVGRAADGAPRFLGDALADPVTGLVAALGALEALEAGGGVLVDAALAACAARAAARLGLRRAA